MIEPTRRDQWVEQHIPMIIGTCRRNTSSEDLAWEAFQETFLVFSRRRADLDLQSNFGPWLYETARRCSQAVARKERRRPTNGVTDLESVTPTVSDDQSGTTCLAETKSMLREELSQLPQADQELLHCLYSESMSHRDVAHRLKCPAGSVYAKAEDARRRLRKRLERRGIVVGALLLLFLLQAQAEAGSTSTFAIAPKKLTPQKFQWRSIALISLVFFAVFTPMSIYSDVPLPSSLGALMNPRNSGGCGCNQAPKTVNQNLAISSPNRMAAVDPVEVTP